MDYAEVLTKVLSEKYPDNCVETGENWELIAKIFYEEGIKEGVRLAELTKG